MAQGGEASAEGDDRRLPPQIADASFLWRRFASALLDFSLLVPIAAVAGVRLWTLLDVPVVEMHSLREHVVKVLVVTWLAMLGLVTYNRWWRQGTTGQSWGKRIMGLRLVRIAGGQPIGPRAAFVRDMFNGFIAVGPALALVHPQGQTLGDVAVGAIVREVRASRHQGDRP
jgi:uncharacterized RDD family membrane protein YckC